MNIFNIFSLRIAAVLAVSMMMVAPCVPASRAADAEITIDNFSFHPDKLSVKAGTTIVFRNRDDIPHTVASAEGVFRSEALDTDDAFSFTFDKPGVYPFFCSLHPKMTGEIIVTP
ncbi:cupredoxin domain-containing protein [Methylocapsa palsarum]|uniref:Plastocyanin n=1 Tax=Methylocapsa palsarum TaxID=1612308 RepID=A0A1I4C093_9HYPH|nr:cupredoxin family copper-binding protein [Methylocapsa palsarum]SFK74482.1 Plastocyanin [Methylocapsa palsarum]